MGKRSRKVCIREVVLGLNMVYVFPNEKGVINRPKPTFGFEMPRFESSGFKLFHKYVSHYWRHGGPHCCPFRLFMDGTRRRLT